MKTFRKALSIILGAAIMLSCLFGMQVSVAAEGNALALSVGEATVADGVVTVPVVVDSNTGFQALTVEVDYDDTVLDLVSAQKATISDVKDVAVAGPTDANPFRLMWAFAETTANVTASGTVATLTFNVVDETAESTDITLNVTEAWDVAGNKVAATAGTTTVDLTEEPVGPVVDDSLVVAGAAVGFGDASLQVNFRVRKTVIQKYDSMELVIIPQKYDLTTLNLATPVETVVPLAVGGTFTTYLYTDIQLYELGLNIDYMLRGYDAEGNLVAVSETFTTSPAAYLKNAFETSTDAEFRTLATDVLVVGQEAVEMMAPSYPDSDLAKAASILEGFDLSEATVDYATPNDVDEFTSYDANFDTPSSATHRVMKSVSIGKVPYIGFRVKDAKSALDSSKFSFSVSYTSLKLDGSTAAYSKEFDANNTTFSKAGQFITFSFDEIGLGDSDKDLAISLNYDGTKVSDMTYSIETYLSGMTTNASVGEMAIALLKLGTSFRAYATK